MSRTLTRRGYNVPVHQSSVGYTPERSETVAIPSNQIPTWGSSFNIDVTEQNVRVEHLTHQFNSSAISVMTSGMFVPTQFWVDHIDISSKIGIIDTYTPLNQFTQLQLFESDEDRALANNACGSYSSTTQAIALAATASSY